MFLIKRPISVYAILRQILQYSTFRDSLQSKKSMQKSCEQTADKTGQQSTCFSTCSAGQPCTCLMRFSLKCAASEGVKEQDCLAVAVPAGTEPAGPAPVPTPVLWPPPLPLLLLLLLFPTWLGPGEGLLWLLLDEQHRKGSVVKIRFRTRALQFTSIWKWGKISNWTGTEKFELFRKHIQCCTVSNCSYMTDQKMAAKHKQRCLSSMEKLYTLDYKYCETCSYISTSSTAALLMSSIQDHTGIQCHSSSKKHSSFCTWEFSFLSKLGPDG